MCDDGGWIPSVPDLSGVNDAVNSAIAEAQRITAQTPTPTGIANNLTASQVGNALMYAANMTPFGAAVQYAADSSSQWAPAIAQEFSDVASSVSPVYGNVRDTVASGVGTAEQFFTGNPAGAAASLLNLAGGDKATNLNGSGGGGDGGLWQSLLSMFKNGATSQGAGPQAKGAILTSSGLSPWVWVIGGGILIALAAFLFARRK